jgi:Protein of unknown function (DUF3168)
VFEQGLVTFLQADSGVSALVGTRIYPVQGPPDKPTYPFITYLNVANSVEYTFSTENDRRRVQFDLWGTTYSAGRALAAALRNALSGLANTTLGDGTVVIFATRLNYIDNFDVQSRSFRSIAEYEFQISES